MWGKAVPSHPFLYIIIAEVLTQCIKADGLIRGVEVNGLEIKLAQHTDDTSTLLIGELSIKALFQNLEAYERVSGAKVNQTKTKGVFLGSSVGRRDKPLGLELTDTNIKILGLPIGNNQSLVSDLWEDKISSITKSLLPWKFQNSL